AFVTFFTGGFLMKQLLARVCLGLSLWAFALPSLICYGQDSATPAPTTEEKLAKLETSVGDAALAGHNAWMLTSCALVLFMTAPGLAMFYGGLVRKKNVLGVMMQCIFLMGLMTVIWAIYGYSLAFGGAPPAADASEADKAANTYSPYIGNTDYLFM